jgi:hypothetical protein
MSEGTENNVGAQADESALADDDELAATAAAIQAGQTVCPLGIGVATDQQPPGEGGAGQAAGSTPP